MSSAVVIFMKNAYVKLYLYAVCLHVSITRQWLGKNFTATTDTRATIELLDTSFSIQSVPIKGVSVGLSVYPLIVASQRLGKHFPAATRNWRRRFLSG
jgi:hypothetical protein